MGKFTQHGPGRVSKTLSEAEACVSAEAETGSGEHGVRDHVFAFLPGLG